MGENLEGRNGPYTGPFREIRGVRPKFRPLKGRNLADERCPTRASFVKFEETGLNFALLRAKFGGRKSAYTALFREFRGVRPKF